MNSSLKHYHKKNRPAHNSPSPVASLPVSISGIGLCCNTGGEPFALYGAVATHLSGACSHDNIGATPPGDDESAKVQFAPVAGLEGMQTPHGRIAALAKTALSATAGKLSEKMPAEAVLVLTLIPEEETRPGADLDLADLQQELAMCHPGINGSDFHFVRLGQGAVETLQQACVELEEGKWQAILFGGADSMVDVVTLSELARNGNVLLQGGGEGVLPGEGAAYLVLGKQGSSEYPARIEALSAATEPHHNEAHENKMTGMATAIQSALKEANVTPDKLDSIVLPFGCTMQESLEWHQTLETVWSRREKVPRTFETLLPAGTIGTTGAADLPLGLALGCARFKFDFIPAERLIVCEAGNGPQRGAVFLNKSPKPAKPEGTEA